MHSTQAEGIRFDERQLWAAVLWKELDRVSADQVLRIHNCVGSAQLHKDHTV